MSHIAIQKQKQPKCRCKLTPTQLEEGTESATMSQFQYEREEVRVVEHVDDADDVGMAEVLEDIDFSLQLRPVGVSGGGLRWVGGKKARGDANLVLGSVLFELFLLVDDFDRKGLPIVSPHRLPHFAEIAFSNLIETH